VEIRREQGSHDIVPILEFLLLDEFFVKRSHLSQRDGVFLIHHLSSIFPEPQFVKV
jgi:hypothetical protein